MFQIRETYLNASEGYQYGDTGWYEPYTEDRGELFRALQQEYGGCVSKVYRERPLPDAAHPGYPATPIADRRLTESTPAGWVFQRREQYADAQPSDRDAAYTREVWVEVRERPEPEREAG